MTEHLSKTPYTIRPYAPKDRERLREICLATATPRVYENRALREWILLMYNDYYTAREGAHCFVGVDDQDRPLGYVICAPSYRRYRLRFLPFLPAIARRSKAAAKRWLFHSGEGAFAKEYPAHLHIDLLPQAQRQGLGRALIAALIAHLKAQGVPGLMLGCSRDHSGANAFYRACGFHILKETADTVYWGMKL
ncbi:MAG: GNAT family N-acetyltransferase [Clostridia bacterium]|nr:GNAT family N-acetyltransferase [Clostridia bacterium]